MRGERKRRRSEWRSETGTYQLLLGIISVSISLLDQLNTEDVELVKVVGGVGGSIGLDAEESQVFDDGSLELGLRLYEGREEECRRKSEGQW